MNKVNKNIFILLILLILFQIMGIVSVFSQGKKNNNIVKGKIFDAETKSIIPNAIIFLKNSTIGICADLNGNYELKNIPSGEYEIVFSFAGYETQSKLISLSNESTIINDVYLKPKVITFNEIEIIGQESKEWQENLEVFKREFIGISINSKKCKIINPEMINFYKDKSKSEFRASTDSVIIIENRSLGYKIFLYLKNFIIDYKNGFVSYYYFPRYEELKPKNQEEFDSWCEKRISCYKGSLKHFLVSTLNGNLENDGFILRGGTSMISFTNQVSNLIQSDSIKIEPISNTNFYEVNFGKLCLQITYFAGPNDYTNTSKQISILESKSDKFIVSGFGEIIEPKNIIRYGLWSQLRLADILPIDYQFSEK